MNVSDAKAWAHRNRYSGTISDVAASTLAREVERLEKREAELVEQLEEARAMICESMLNFGSCD